MTQIRDAFLEFREFAARKGYTRRVGGFTFGKPAGKWRIQLLRAAGGVLTINEDGVGTYEVDTNAGAKP
jgi:hypothetical protein